MPAATPNEVRDAVRETVKYRRESSERARPSRSHTTTSQPPSKPAPRRSTSVDVPIQEKSRSSGKSRPKKGSQHADVIDRLDFTGVGPMFHHDGPFDACAPSRNKHTAKAPMMAWGGQQDLAKQLSSGQGAYPSPYAYDAFSNDYPEPPKKKVDAIAEAWGIHEPEPFEDFSAGGGSGRHEGDTPASSIYNGRGAHRQREESSRGVTTSSRRGAVPPPQPIFMQESSEGEQTGSPPASPGFPKRSKSLMQRIRKMRDAPNVPAAPEYETPPSPNLPSGAQAPDGYSRPTHKSQNSFLGRFGVKSNQSAPLYSSNEEPEPYVYINNQNTSNQDKALPPPPPGHPVVQSLQNQGRSQMSRRPSLIKRVGNAVRGK